MSVFGSESADRVAAVVFMSGAAVPFGRIVSASGLSEQAVAAALRRLAAGHVVARVDVSGRPAWAADASDPLYGVNKTILVKLAAGAGLAPALAAALRGFSLVRAAVFLDERPEALLVCALSDTASLGWYDVLGRLGEEIEVSGRAVRVETVGEREFAEPGPRDLVMARVRAGNPLWLKGGAKG